MATFTETITTTFVVIDCGNCGIQFGLTKKFQDQRLQDHVGFYCPNGHRLHYPGESREEALARQLSAAKGNAKAERERLDREKRSHAATKGKLTKTKKRVAGGACPCCNRSFVDLGRHMSGQHPDYVEAKS